MAFNLSYITWRSVSRLRLLCVRGARATRGSESVMLLKVVADTGFSPFFLPSLSEEASSSSLSGLFT